jgi:Rrf2 family protein
LEHRG